MFFCLIFELAKHSLGAGVQWLAYSPNGTVEADVVYCHYGTEEDFQYLKQLGISIKGKIVKSFCLKITFVFF